MKSFYQTPTTTFSLMVSIMLFFVQTLFAETEPLRPPGLPQTQFEISTLAHLRWLSEGDGTADTVNTKRRQWHYVLTADIDASETKYWNMDDHDNDENTADVYMGFYPIGHFHSTPTRFQGSFDGKGHNISNLYIYHQKMSGDHVGLFGSVESNFFIKDLIVSNVDFTGKYGGALVSRLHKGDINNCHSSGTIKASWGGIGGLIGDISYIPKVSLVVVENCSSSCNIETFSVNNTNTSYVGGFIGNLHAYHKDKVFVSIRNCKSSGTISGHNRSTSIGGFAGKMSDSLYVENCTSAGDVSGAADVGGFVGVSGGVMVTIKNCHVTGEVTAISDISNKFRIGGFIGNLGSWTTIDNCSTIAEKVLVSEEHESVGGFVGAFSGTPNCLTTIKNSFTLCNVNGESSIGGFIGHGAGQAYSVLRIQDCYSKGNVSAIKNRNGGFAGYSPEFVSNCIAYGKVTSTNGYDIGGFVGRGSGTKLENCYAYGNVTGGNKTGGFAGSCSIDTILNCHANQEEVIGQESVGGFCGDLSNLSFTKFCSATAHISATGDNVGGFVGITTANILNSVAIGNSYTKGNYCGGFIGRQTGGTTTQCYATGNAAGIKGVGGFAGEGNQMKECFSTGNSSGVDYIGAFSGYDYNYIDDCFGSGYVNCSGDKAGGVLGDRGIITNSYSSSKIQGAGERIGGIVGSSSMSSSKSCYFDKNYNENLQGTGDGKYLEEHIGLSTEQFANQSNFKGWDFSSIWQIATIAQIDIYPRPYHQWYLNNNESVPYTSLQIKNQISYTETGFNQNSIQIIMPFNYDITSLALDFELPEGMVLVINDSVQISGVTLNDFSQPVICYFISAGTKSAVSGLAEIDEAEMWVIEVENKKYQVAFNNTTGGKILGDTLQYIVKDSSTTEVLATPASGYRFSEWLDESGNSFSKDSVLFIDNINKNAEYTALFEVATGLNNFKQRSFDCFPLPCYNELTVQFSKEYTGSIQILNISGSKIKEINIEYAKTETIDISKLQQGVYIIKANNNCMKIIKK
jgi:hypothetical protein